MGVYRLEASIGYANGSLLVAVVVALLAAGAAAVAYCPKAWPVALAAVGVLLAAVGLGAWKLDAKYSQRARDTYFPADARWVDHAGVGDVTILNTPGSRRELTLEQMFWNRSIKRLVRLRKADSPDVFSTPQVRIRPDGAMLVDGKPLRTALLMNEYAVTAVLRGAKSVAATRLFELWKPVGTPRLRLHSGYVRIWDSPGTLRLRLGLPTSAPKARLVFRARGERRIVEVAPGSSRVVKFEVPAGVWTVRWKGPLNYLPDFRPVSVRADELRLEPLQRGGADADT
jgi:hypothetical protein